jgi:hypothetical protein
MNGPKHYADAETLLAMADKASVEAMAAAQADASFDTLPALAGVFGLVIAAQVHATLAQAAATAGPDVAWAKVLGGGS